MDVAGFTKTFVIDQGTVLGMDPLFHALFNAPLTDGKRQGICTGLSMIWLARMMMFHDETPKQRLATLGSMAGFRWGGRTQDIHVKSSAAGGGTGSTEELYQSWYGEALRAYVLRIVPGSVVDNPYTSVSGTAKALVPAVTPAGTYSLYNIGLRTAGGSAGHMVASYASHGTLGLRRHFYFFDPNMGEYRIGVGEVEKFLEQFIIAYQGVFLGVTYFDTFKVRRG